MFIFGNAVDGYRGGVYNIGGMKDTGRGYIDMCEEHDCCVRTKHTPRSEEDQKLLKNRLNRIVGQLNGISRMLDENRYCGDILMQIAAVESALQSVGYMILKEHMETCVAEGVRAGNNEVLAEAFELMKKLK